MPVVDRWHKNEKQPDGSTKRVPSAEYGVGMRWQVRYIDDEGKPTKKNFEKEAQAKTFDAEVTVALNNNEYVSPDRAKTTFEEYSTKIWLPARTCDEGTKITYERVLRIHANPVLGKFALSTLANTPSLIQAWISRCEGSPSSVERYRGVVSSVFNCAISDGYISRNPCNARTITLPGKDKTKVIPLTTDEALRLASFMGEIVVVGVGTGLRQGELFGLSPDDVCARTNIIRVERQVKMIRGKLLFSLPKGRKTREVPVPESTMLAIKAHLTKQSPLTVALPWQTTKGKPRSVSLLFHRRNGPHLRKDFNNAWKVALKKSGLPATRQYMTHVMRHTYASVLLSSGVDVRTLAEYLGHSDPGFTLRTYTHLLPKSADKVRSAVDIVFKIRADSGQMSV